MEVLKDLNAMIKRVRFLIDESSTKSFSNEDITESINIGSLAVQDELVKLDVGYYEKLADLNQDEAEPGTLPGTELYLLPSDFRRFKEIRRMDTGSLIRPRPVQYKAATRPNLVNIGGPAYYYVSGQNVGLTPVPDGHVPIQMLYIYRLPALDAAQADGVSELPPEWRELACLAAAIDAKEKDEADTTTLERKWKRERDRLLDTESDRQVQEPKRVLRAGRTW